MKFDCSTYLACGIGNALLSKPDLSRRILQEFGQYAQKIIAAQSIKLVSMNIREWVSVEDRTWKQLIIDFMVETQPEIALELWDNLSDELRTFINTKYEKEAFQLYRILSVTVRW